MKVYVLEHGYEYETVIIHGVYASPEAANEDLMDLVAGMASPYAGVDEPREFEGAVIYNGRGRFVSLTPYEVQS